MPAETPWRWVNLGVEEEEMGAREVTLERLEDQIGWYDRRSAMNRRGYRACKVIELVAAALIALSPALAKLGESGPGNLAPWWPYLASGLGALVTILVGLQHLYQFHANYVSYRSTCESLRHEKFLYHAGAGPYADAANPDRLLAERVEAMTSAENAQWVSTALQPAREEAAGGAPPPARSLPETAAAYRAPAARGGVDDAWEQAAPAEAEAEPGAGPSPEGL